MILFKKTAELETYLQKTKQTGSSIGFVPTMGALHTGHISLVHASRKENQLTVASIFINPAQFNDKKDFEKYPVTIEKDIELLIAAGCNVLFWPPAKEIYPQGYSEPSNYDLGYLETILEGKYRPGHFQGVCKVMNRLIDIVKPDNLYMGQKDYQQCMVVKRLLAIMKLPVVLHTGETRREADGLAMSSRNARLNPEERKRAVTISQTLRFIEDHIEPGNLAAIIDKSIAMLTETQFKVDYVAIADAQSLELLTQWNGTQKIVALIAAFQNEVRLIDNMILN